jgi:hypothetical protein
MKCCAAGSILSGIQGQTSMFLPLLDTEEEFMLLPNSQWHLRSMYSLANTHDATFPSSIKVMHNGMDTIMEFLAAHGHGAGYPPCKHKCHSSETSSERLQEWVKNAEL